MLAGNKAKAEPYHQGLFGGIPAKRAASFGPEKVKHLGETLLEKIAAVGNAVLDGLAATLAEAQKVLLAKDEARDAAEVKLAGRAIERIKWVQTVQHAANHAEVAILTAHPGRDDLVRAVLAIPRAEPKKPSPTEPTEPTETTGEPQDDIG